MRQPYVTWRLVFATALALAAAAEPLTAQSALERVRAAGRLRVGIDATHPRLGLPKAARSGLAS